MAKRSFKTAQQDVWLGLRRAVTCCSNRRRRLQFEQLEDRRLLATLPSGFTETAVASNLTSPITMDIEDNGRIWLAFQDGRIGVIENDALLPSPAIQLDCDGTGERGLQGLELDPDFDTNGYIYVYYTAAHNQAQQLASHNQVSRLTVNPTTQNTITPGSEVVLLELPEFSTLPANQSPIWHMGGALQFLPDETLLVQTGDHLNNSLVQNNNAPLGKVLRMNKDGTPVVNNPFYDPADNNPPAAAIGTATRRAAPTGSTTCGLQGCGIPTAVMWTRQRVVTSSTMWEKALGKKLTTQP